MKYLILILMTGCATMHKTAMRGTVDVVEDEWVAVEVGSATDTKTWVKLNRKNMKTLKEGDRVIFYVKVESGEE